MGLRCFLFGHKMKWRDEGSANIDAPSECVRCGHKVPAVVWSGIHESKTRGNMKPLMAESHRPAPPMPEHQVLKVKVGDTVVITADRVLSVEQRAFMAQAVKVQFPDGVKVMILDGGMKIAVVSPQREGAAPDAPMPWEPPYAGYQPRPTSAATAPPPPAPPPPRMPGKP